ncbi:MAG: hypothetical protein LBL09_02955 [Oscillospiraceae bacterium]|nr:hypothetical protein [Oscillospiraceae bacterium]
MPEEALRFHQPIFKDRYNFNGRGRINKNEYNRLTWIIGANHLAVFINDELRYCGVNFPYMGLDLSRELTLPIIIGSNGQGCKYFKSIRVSQLAYTPKTKIRKEELAMITKQSNNMIPVIRCGGSTGVFVGYEDYGKVLLYITGDKSEPEWIALNETFAPNPFHGYDYKSGWIFVGDKKENRPLARIYREAIQDIAPMQRIKTDAYCFGAEAFRAWAKDIEDGKFDKVTLEAFDPWCDHTNYVCTLATNGSCCHGFLKRAQELNPDIDYLEKVSTLYRRIAEMWGGDNNHNDPDSLEALGGGFNVTLEVLQDKEKRAKIAAKIREFADVTDEIVRIIQANI